MNHQFARLDDKTGRVDRHLQCPFLLRVFVNKNKHQSEKDYERNNLPMKEVQIYTWPDTNLRDLSELIMDVNQETKSRGTKFRFAVVFPIKHGYGYRIREMGVVVNGQSGPDDSMTLAKAGYIIGEYIDVALEIRDDRSESPDRRNSSNNRDRRRH